MKQIIVEISETGEVKIEARGFKGSACEQATREIELALGVPGKKTRTPEFYQSNANQTRVTQ